MTTNYDEQCTLLYIEDGTVASSVVRNKNLPILPLRVATLARMESV